MKKIIIFIGLMFLLISCENIINTNNENIRNNSITQQVEKLDYSNIGGGGGIPQNEQGNR